MGRIKLSAVLNSPLTIEAPALSAPDLVDRAPLQFVDLLKHRWSDMDGAYGAAFAGNLKFSCDHGRKSLVAAVCFD